MSYNLNILFPKPAYALNAAVADQRLSVDDVAVSFSAFNTITVFVLVDVQAQDVFVTFDGSAPTTTNGHLLTSGSQFTWSRATATAAKFINKTNPVTITAVLHASEFQN